MPEPDFSFDFFVSRRGSVADAAREVADVLEQSAYRVKLQDYDFAGGGNFVLDIHDALKAARNLIILHSADYEDSPWTRQEFANFLAAKGRENGRRLILLRCDQTQPKGLLDGVTCETLFGVTDKAERQALILRAARGEAPASRQVPKIFGGAMPSENPLFTGRGLELDQLHRLLGSGSGVAALTQAAIHGLGGVGKTATARAYVQRHANDYSGVWWIGAETRAGIEAGLADLARAFNPNLPADFPTLDAASYALREMDRGDHRLLLVYDNVPDPDALTGLTPHRGARLLITSRWSDWEARAEKLELPVMPKPEAVSFLRRRAGREDAAEAARLAEELGFLPLALEHAAAYCKRTLLPFAAYRTRYEAMLAQVPKGTEYPRSVAATFNLAIEQAARDAPGAEPLLGLMAVLGQAPMPMALFEAEEEGARGEAIAALMEVSLVSAEEIPGIGAGLSVHRLVQAVMRGRLAAAGGLEAQRATGVAALLKAFPEEPEEKHLLWPLCRALRPHVMERREQQLGFERAAALPESLDRLGRYLISVGDAKAAEPVLRDAWEMRQTLLGLDDPATWMSANNLARCYRDLGRLQEAQPLYESALRARERILGQADKDTLTSVNNLASCLQARGDAAAAEPLFRRALEAAERILGPEHRNTLSSISNLASCLQARGDAAASEPLHRRALDGRERTLGPEHPDTLTSINNLAGCLQARGDAAASEPLHRRALDGRERTLGPEHPDTLTSINNLATCLQARGDAAAAEPLYRRALEAQDRILGPEHPSTLTSINNLAVLLGNQGKLNAAEALLNRTWQRLQQKLGAKHPTTRHVRAQLDKVRQAKAQNFRGGRR